MHIYKIMLLQLYYTNFALDFPSLNWTCFFFVKNILLRLQTPLPFLEGKIRERTFPLRLALKLRLIQLELALNESQS